jgi:hypothetical protein
MEGKMPRQSNYYYDVFYGTRKKLLIVFYVVSVISIILLGLLVLNLLASIALMIQIIATLLLTVVATIGGAFLNVLFDLPQISKDFDVIKNAIAAKEIKTPDEFAKSINSLLCKFFNFSFFNIIHSTIRILDSDYIYSDPNIPNCLDKDNKSISFQDITFKSKKTEDIFYVGEFQLEEKTNSFEKKGNRPILRKYHLYTIPIWFGNDWLGFMAIFTEKKLGKIFQSFMADFENEHVDDQLLHVLNYQKGIRQKNFYRKMDEFSNKVTKDRYESVYAFQQDVIDLLVAETNSDAGLFATIYEEDCSTVCKKSDFDLKKTIEYYKDYFTRYQIPAEPYLRKDENVPSEFIFEIPIFIDSLQGVILLFSSDDSKFKYFEKTLIEIENIKLDNDLENLAKRIKASVKPNAFIKPR